ncbi:MAG: hypothetical protein KAJ91_05120 [Candidatus Aenigmarchaeota archaeon]|nr:hypothetical protein [Candidatus Aenigmarchaeota archaeon]
MACIDLKRPRLTRKNFENIIKNRAMPLIFFNAHGDAKTIYGDKTGIAEEVLVKEGVNHRILDSKIVYARACWAAASLGKSCKGGCFMGYNIPFSFWLNEKWSAKPANDSTAKMFFEPSNLVVSSLLKGNTAEDAVNNSANLTKKTILKLLRTKDEPGATASAMLLWNNMQGTAIVGNKEMRLE